MDSNRKSMYCRKKHLWNFEYFFLCLLTFSFSNDNSIWPKMLQNKKCNRDDEKYDANTNNSIAKSERKLARFTNYKNDKE